MPDPENSGCKVAGCGLGCVGTLIGGPLLFAFVAYAVVMHTSMPLKWFLENADMDSGGSTVEFRGIGGSLSSGVTIDTIIIDSKPEPTTIEGFAFRYNGLWDALRNTRLVIEELSTTRSDIVVGADFFDITARGETAAPTEAADDAGGLALFELRTLNFADTRFRTADGEVDIKIPLIRLSGLKIEGDDFDLAELVVDSDALKLELADASPVEIAGQTLPFKRQVVGAILSDFHPRVRSAIDFRVELAAVNGKTKSRITAFGDAYQHVLLPDGNSLVQIKNLTLGDFIDVDGAIIPERLTLTARQADQVVSVGSGEFFLAATRFDIAEQKVNADDDYSAIVGQAEITDHRITARLRPDKTHIWPPFTVDFEAEPALDQPELLALIYFQRPYDELQPAEKARIDALSVKMGREPR